MELHADERPPRDRRHERGAMGRLRERQCIRAGSGLRREGVDEVEVGGLVDPVEQRVGATPLHLVPADVRQTRRLPQADRSPGQHAEGFRAVLVAPLEQELEAQADPEQGPVIGDPRPDGRLEATAPQAGHGGTGGADAGDHERVGTFQGRGPAGHHDVGSRGGERLLDAHEVAGPVVDDRDPRHPRLPFVEGTAPARRGSSATAARRARASALNAASAR